MTTMASPAARISRDRVFYTGVWVFTALMVLIGFSRSYYLSAWFDTPKGTPPYTPLLMVHGAVFTSWIALGVVQPSLIAANRRQLHRRLGWIMAGVAVAMVMLGNLAAIQAMHQGFIGLGDPRAFYAIPFFAINVFAVIVALAIWKRNEAETHKRLILLSSTQIIEAAVARVPLAFLGSYAPWSFVLSGDLIILAGIAYDLATRGKVHPVWIWGGLAVLATQIARVFIMGTEPWMAFAGFVSTLWPGY